MWFGAGRYGVGSAESVSSDAKCRSVVVKYGSVVVGERAAERDRRERCM